MTPWIVHENGRPECHTSHRQRIHMGSDTRMDCLSATRATDSDASHTHRTQWIEPRASSVVGSRIHATANGARQGASKIDMSINKSNSTLENQSQNHSQNAICRSLRRQHTVFLTVNLALTLKSGVAIICIPRWIGHPRRLVHTLAFARGCGEGCRLGRLGRHALLPRLALGQDTHNAREQAQKDPAVLAKHARLP